MTNLWLFSSFLAVIYVVLTYLFNDDHVDIADPLVSP